MAFQFVGFGVSHSWERIRNRATGQPLEFLNDFLFLDLQFRPSISYSKISSWAPGVYALLSHKLFTDCGHFSPPEKATDVATELPPRKSLSEGARPSRKLHSPARCTDLQRVALSIPDPWGGAQPPREVHNSRVALGRCTVHRGLRRARQLRPCT